MKKVKFFPLIVVILFMLLISTASPARAAGLTLVDVASTGSRGLILTFDVGAGYSGATFGSASVGWSVYPMYCGLAGNGKLVCYIGAGIFKHHGKTALVSLDGQEFSITIPEGRPDRLPSWFCEEFPFHPRCGGGGGDEEAA